MKICVVDDELHIRNIIGDYLRNDGYEVVTCKDGLDCLEQLKVHKDVSLILLDVRMPKMSGFQVFPEIKKVTDVPILFLTALDETYDEVRGLSLGADDYITKPFRYEILMARVKAVLRRYQTQNAKVFSMANMQIDYLKREIYVDGHLLDLTKLEYELMAYFADNYGFVLDRNRILDKIWGIDYYGDPRTVDTHVKTLRAKLGPCGEWIRTKRGVGYQFKVAQY